MFICLYGKDLLNVYVQWCNLWILLKVCHRILHWPDNPAHLVLPQIHPFFPRLNRLIINMGISGCCLKPVEMYLNLLLSGNSRSRIIASNLVSWRYFKPSFKRVARFSSNVVYSVSFNIFWIIKKSPGLSLTTRILIMIFWFHIRHS